MCDKDKKSILIISYYFSPNGEVGAIRPSKVAELLAIDGYEVSVFTNGLSRNDGGFIIKTPIDVFRIINERSLQEDYNHHKNKTVVFNAKRNIIIYSLKQHYRYFLDFRKDFKFYKQFKIYYTKRKEKEYDVIYTTANPISTIFCGLFLKKRCSSIKWICEFRDPLVDEATPLLFRGFLSLLQRYSCRKCDNIVSVSEGYLKRICKRHSDQIKAHMIPNGYDLRDRIMGKRNDSTKMRFVYVGSLYEGRRDISPLFNALSDLIKSDLIDDSLISVEYAGNDFAYLLAQANQYGLDGIIVNHNRLSHQQCIKLQLESHILILSTWNNKGEEGVFPGKFLEYMLINKPIINLVSGELCNSEVTRVIEEGKLGISYEEATSREDFIRLSEYILECYQQFLDDGEVLFKPNQNVIDRYDYRKIISKFEEIIDE